MKIGELAKLAKCKVELIRFYENAKLLTKPNRAGNGYRDYTEIHLDRLIFIRRCREMNIALGDINKLIELANTPQSHCEDVHKLIDEQISKTQNKLNEIKTLQRQLKFLRQQCTGKNINCGILQELNRKKQLTSISPSA